MTVRASDAEAVSAGRARVRRAIGEAREGRLGSARREIAAALAVAPEDPIVLVTSGIVLFVTRDYDRSLAVLARSAERGIGTRAHWLRRERAARLGWDLDAKEALEAGARAEPYEPRWFAALLALHAHRKAYSLALRDGAAVTRLAPDAPSPWMEIAGVHAALADRAQVEACLARAIACADAIPIRLEAARLLRSVGAFEAARAHLEEVLVRSPEELDAIVWLAEMALWAGDHARASELVARAPSLAASHRVLGAIAWIERRRPEAVARLESAIAIDRNDADAHAWLAEIAIDEGRWDDAHDRISRAIVAASGQLFAGHVLRLRVKLEEDLPVERVIDAHMVDHQRAPLRALCPELASTLEGFDRDAWRTLLDRALARMHGNRSRVATHLAGGELRLVPHVRDPRVDSRRVLERVRVEPIDALLRELDALAAEYPSSSLPLAHKGELLLWAGRIAEARAALERATAIVRGTRWAYIGLAAVDVLEGRPDRALETTAQGIRIMRNTTGPAVYGTRGEALRHLGRLEEAERDLAHAVALNRSRVAAWVDLALVRIARGDHAGARAAAAEVVDLAPGLVSDAARELGEELCGDEGEPTIEILGRVLERALAMMRGNRSSSCVTYATRDGKLRFGRASARDPQPLHAKDRDELELALRVLERGPAVLPHPGRARRPAPAASSREAPARQTIARAPSLTAAERERFLTHGFVRLDGCLAPDVVRAWVAGVTARIERDPRAWLRWDPVQVPPPGPEHVDLGDPRSFPGDAVVVVGDVVRPLAAISRRLSDAIEDLVGPDRLRTRSISDHVILRVPWLRDVPDHDARKLQGWHIDNPQQRATIGSITNGLLALVLLSDVEPDGGATWIAPGSVAHVARLLASRPEGVDLTDPAVGAAIAERCPERVECSGRAGDVYLAHPLMLHCGSINRRSTFRWLSNPNFELNEPLDPRRDRGARSPVEEAVARALGA